MDQQNHIVEGEVIAEKTDDLRENAAVSLTALVSLIQTYIGNIDNIKKDLATNKQMLEDFLSNDPVYNEDLAKAKEANKRKMETKSKLMRQPQLQQLAEKIKELSQEMREAKETLSSYLQDYAQTSGQRQIEDARGEINEIVYMAKLIKGFSVNKPQKNFRRY